MPINSFFNLKGTIFYKYYIKSGLFSNSNNYFLVLTSILLLIYAIAYNSGSCIGLFFILNI